MRAESIVVAGIRSQRSRPSRRFGNFGHIPHVGSQITRRVEPIGPKSAARTRSMNLCVTTHPRVISICSAAGSRPRWGRARRGSHSHSNSGYRNRGVRRVIQRDRRLAGSARRSTATVRRARRPTVRRSESADARAAVCIHRMAHHDALQLAGPTGAAGHPGKLGLENRLDSINVRWWVGETEIPRMLVRTYHIAMPLGRQEGTGPAVDQVRHCHATLPRAVRLDGSVAPAEDGSPVLAAGAGRRR